MYFGSGNSVSVTNKGTFVTFKLSELTICKVILGRWHLLGRR